LILLESVSHSEDERQRSESKQSLRNDANETNHEIEELQPGSEKTDKDANNEHDPVELDVELEESCSSDENDEESRPEDVSVVEGDLLLEADIVSPVVVEKHHPDLNWSVPGSRAGVHNEWQDHPNGQTDKQGREKSINCGVQEVDEAEDDEAQDEGEIEMAGLEGRVDVAEGKVLEREGSSSGDVLGLR